MQNFDPKSQQQNERPIGRDQRSFAGGAFDDISSSKIPADGVKWLKNYVAFADRIESRGGSKKWTSYQLPKASSGISAVKSYSAELAAYIVTFSAPQTFTAGDYIHYDDGGFDVITSDNISSTIAPVGSSTSHADSTAAWLQSPVWGWAYHVGHDIIVMHVGSKLYAAKSSFAADSNHGLSAGWNLLYGQLTETASGGPSEFYEYGDYLIMFGAQGIYAISLNHTATITKFWKINTPCPTQRLTNNTIKSDTLIYGYRHQYAMSRIRGAGMTGDRTTSGAVMELQSGPVTPDATTYKDYGESWFANKIGPSDAADQYTVWTGNALPAAYDTITEMAALNNAQFKITVSGTAYNIACDFTGVKSWAEIANIIEIAIREYLPQMYVSFNSSSVFVFYNLVKGSTITAFAAGDSGTSIHTMFSTGAGVATNWDVPALLNTASYIAKCPLDSSSVAVDHWTHYSIYRTLDIGKYGVDGITGQGNNKELYVWVADHLLVKPFKCTVVTAATPPYATTLTATSAVFTADDVGKVITFQNGATATITGFTSSTVVTTGSTPDQSAVGASIGSSIMDVASKAALVVTATNSIFEATHVGRTIFWQDGTQDVITGYTSATQVTVALSGTKTSLGMGMLPTSMNIRDRVSDDTLATRIAGFSLMNRFWQPLPSLNTGIVANGFLIGAVRDGRTVYYGQVPEGFSYLWGYYNNSEQLIQYKDLISAVRYMNDEAIIFCRNTIHRVPLNNYQTKTIESVGEVIVILTGTAVITPEVGCVDYGSIRPIDTYTIAFITSDNELQLLSFNGSYTLSGDLAKDRFSKRLRLNAGYTSTSYDKVNGLILWIKTESTAGRAYGAGSFISEPLDASYRFAIKKDQGVGVSENTGAAWIMPPSRVGAIQVYDSSNQIRTIIIDHADGYIYDFTSKEGPTDSNVARLWKDKLSTTGTGGTHILPEVLFGLDEGAEKRFFLQHKRSHVFLEPFDRSNAGESGYDSEGHPTGLEIDLTLYQDGDSTTVKARAEDVDRTGDVVLDRVIRAHGLQMKVSANMSEHIISARLMEYEVEDKTDAPTADTTTEMDNQAAVGNVDFELLPLNGSIINRVTGQAPTTAAGTLVTGPEGASKAISLATGTIEDTTKTLTYTGDFSVKIGVSSINATGTYFYIGTAFSVRIYLDGATYKVAVLYNGSTTTTSLTWDGTGWCDITVSRTGTAIEVIEGVQ